PAATRDDLEHYVIPINRHPNHKGDALVATLIWPHLRGPLLELTNSKNEYDWFGSPLSWANRRTRRCREPFRDRTPQNLGVTQPAPLGLVSKRAGVPIEMAIRLLRRSVRRFGSECKMACGSLAAAAEPMKSGSSHRRPREVPAQQVELWAIYSARWSSTRGCLTPSATIGGADRVAAIGNARRVTNAAVKRL